MSHWQQWIDPEWSIVIVVCWVVGFILKRTPHIASWTIVYWVTALAIIIMIALEGWHIQSWMTGILCGAFAVYGHQLFKQLREGLGQDEDRY